MIECESCNKFFEDSGIVWDLKEDRLVCTQCLPDSRGCDIKDVILENACEVEDAGDR